MPTGAWLLEHIFPLNEEPDLLSGCWFSLLLSSLRLRGSGGLFSCSDGLGGEEGEDWASPGLAVNTKKDGGGDRNLATLDRSR